MHNYKNSLIQYQGGGAPGEFWSWNYFAIDQNGEFHDIGSSGRNALDTAEKAQKFLDEYEETQPHKYLYDLNSEKDIDEFQVASNAGHVVSVVNKVNNIDTLPDMWFRCDICGEKCFAGRKEGWQGAGGIAVEATIKVCSECYAYHTCPKCGEFDMEELEPYEDKFICKYCIEDLKLKEQEANK